MKALLRLGRFIIPAFFIVFFSFLIPSQDFSDSDIEGAITDELIARQETDSRIFTIQSIEGLVILEGDVSNILERETAIQIAKSIRNVRGVLDKTQLVVSFKDDQKLQSLILNSIQAEAAINQLPLEIKVDNGVAVSSGTAFSLAQKELVSRIIKRTEGIWHLDNHILIEYKEKRNDREIFYDVTNILNWDIRVNHELLSVSVNNGIISISGDVKSNFEKGLLMRIVSVNGFTGTNFENLRVRKWIRDRGISEKSPSDFTDEEIFDAMADLLLLDNRLRGLVPEIHVEGRKITLSGMVDNLFQKIIMEEIAHNVAGVWQVENNLIVSPRLSRTDDMVTDKIIDAFILDAFLTGYDIIVNVIEGTVHLTGTVENYFEREHASEVAMSINGVKEVINNITVTKGFYRRENGLSPLSTYFYEEGKVLKSDWDLFTDISDKIFFSSFVNLGEVQVEVNNGHVVLRGIVDTWEQKILIEQHAIEEGALTVINKIEVRHK
jgi:osmotically-inducible protein OsmY